MLKNSIFIISYMLRLHNLHLKNSSLCFLPYLFFRQVIIANRAGDLYYNLRVKCLTRAYTYVIMTIYYPCFGSGGREYLWLKCM